METGDATREQAAAAANQARESERRAIVAQKGKHVPALAARPQKVSLHLPGPGEKRPREEETRRTTTMSPARRPMERPTPRSPHQPQVRTPQTPRVPSTGGTAANEVPREASSEEVNFLQAGQSVKLRLFNEVAGAWGLRPATGIGPANVSSDELLYAEAFAKAVKTHTERRRAEAALLRYKGRVELLQKERAKWEAEKEELEKEKAAWEAEKEGLRRELEVARSEAAANAERAAKAEERGERRGRKRGNHEARDLYRKVLSTLTSVFDDDDYHDAYLKYVEDREKAVAEGRDPDEVVFPLASMEEAAVEDTAMADVVEDTIVEGALPDAGQAPANDTEAVPTEAPEADLVDPVIS